MPEIFSLISETSKISFKIGVIVGMLIIIATLIMAVAFGSLLEIIFNS